MLSFPAFAAWKEKVLYSFQGGTDGSIPFGGIVLDKQGNIYGANSQSGSQGCPMSGCGTVFEVSPSSQKAGNWTETTLYTFKGLSEGLTDGAVPTGGLIADKLGNLYGTTAYGGNGRCKLAGSTTGCGVVYELSPPAMKGGQWTYAILYNFQGENDGQFPWGDLSLDETGNLYGATQFGGGKGTTCDPFYSYCGTVFELNPPKQKGGSWKERVLHSFAGGTDGANPNGELVLDVNGVVYGTTQTGGNQRCKSNYGVGCGTAFALSRESHTRRWSESLFHRFTGGDDGANPMPGLTLDGTGALYGACSGGKHGFGIIFRFVESSRSGKWKQQVLYNFVGLHDGRGPWGPVTLDSEGNVYGTAMSGPGQKFGGVVFELSPGTKKGWSYKVLYNFPGAPDGAYPLSRINETKSGSLSSTTRGGGSGQACSGGCGTVFELSP
jgi:hypothetical protein